MVLLRDLITMESQRHASRYSGRFSPKGNSSSIAKQQAIGESTKVAFTVRLLMCHALRMDKPFEPQDDLAVALASEVRAIAGQLKRKLREYGNFDELTPSQISVLVRLEREGPTTVSGLARAEGMRPQSMGAITAGLEAAGLVKGTPDPKDGRQVFLSLTAACLDRIITARATRQDWLYRIIQAELTLAEQDQLATGLALLARIIEA